MPNWLITILGIFGNLFANHSGDLVKGVEQGMADGTTIFHDIAQGEGGIKKLTQVASDLATTAGHAATVLAEVQSAGSQSSAKGQ